MEQIVFMIFIFPIAILSSDQQSIVLPTTQDIYEIIIDCCAKHNYSGNIVPIPMDIDEAYGNCYKCCCMHCCSFGNSSKKFNLENDFLSQKLYLYNNYYKEAFERCQKTVKNQAFNGIYFHEFRKCMAARLNWNLALNPTVSLSNNTIQFGFRKYFEQISESLLFFEENHRKSINILSSL